MEINAIKTDIFLENENLAEFVYKNLPSVRENSIIIVTSKIVALSEGRTTEIKNEGEKEKLIKDESDFAIKTKHVWLTIKDGAFLANAGIDESNANNKLVLLPKDSFASAEILRAELLKKYGVTNLGIIITDSRTIPLRAGVVGVALGYAGIKGVRDYRGKPDLFGRKLKFSRTNVADSLATSAVLEMGEGSEQSPIAVITNASVEFCAKIQKSEIKIPTDDDMYFPFLKINVDH